MLRSTFVAILVFLGSFPLYAQSIAATYETILYDASGRPMGPLVATASSPSGYVLRFRLDDGRSVALGTSGSNWFKKPLYFQTTDCTGAPFIKDGEPRVSLPGAVSPLIGFDGGIYFEMADPFMISSPGSMLIDTCQSNPPYATYVSVQRYLDLDNFFTEPFTVSGGVAPAQATFSDVPTTHPYYQFIEMLSASGITGGCGGGKYCPDSPLTRGQMAVFLTIALGMRFRP